MASGSSGRSNNQASKGFDFGSDDILCSYDDNYSNQDASNGTQIDMEFHKSRMARSSVIPATSYSLPEDNFNQDMISTVERTMKKQAENLMRFLEGISSRLSQLELYCYNLDKSIGEMRIDLIRDHGEADTKLKSLEKHLQEVHRSVQILRDKQELAETQKELAKLQLAQKESSSTSHVQQNEEKAVPPASDPKKTDISSDVHGQQLALALPHQIPQQSVFNTRPIEQQQQPMAPSLPPPQPQSVPPQSISESQGYYLPPPQMSNTPIPGQQSAGQYLPSDSHYSTCPAPQMQDLSRVVPQPTQSQVNQAPQVQPLPQYQQQWPQQVPQQAQPPQQPSMQAQNRPSSTAIYRHMPSQPSSQETLPGSMPMQVPFCGVSQSGASVTCAEVPYGYGGTGRPIQVQRPMPHVEVPFGAQQGDGYAAARQQPSLSLGNAYMIYGEGGRAHHSPPQAHFPQGVYPTNSAPLQNLQPSTVRLPQLTRNHPYNELIDKLVSMGYRSDHVASVIHRLEESGQPVDFNAVLDRLNGNSSGGSQRGWSG